MKTSKEIVSTFLQALNSEDFATAKTCLASDVQFIGVMGTRDSADDYIADMEKMKFKYEILFLAEEGNDVAVFYNIDMGGVTALCAGWYHVAYHKIKTMKVIFDPRPVINAQKKK